ncbi:helix-turn-helix domain-containing protein [Streptomyces sp. NPDC091416]|uniref:helix-turn-helix domain-containing protein n=1 Tax=Streptomyces sp. NPDC091416 TaxID=3366003 RepID=UPI0037FAC0DB
MRYPQGGGVTDVERDARERVRRQAVTRFETGGKNRGIAAMLRVAERSVERWRRQWREDGYAGVASKGSPGRPRLSDAQMAKLEQELERGPLAHGGGRPAVDAGPREDGHRQAVPRLIHRGGHVAPAAALWLVLAAADPACDRA